MREDQGWGWGSEGVLVGRGREMFPLLSGQAVNSPSGSCVCLGLCCSWVCLRFPGVPGETECHGGKQETPPRCLPALPRAQWAAAPWAMWAPAGPRGVLSITAFSPRGVPSLTVCPPVLLSAPVSPPLGQGRRIHTKLTGGSVSQHPAGSSSQRTPRLPSLLGPLSPLP